MPTSVRRATPDDHAAVAELTASVYRGEGFSSADYEPQLRDVASRAATATVLVAEDGARLLGAVTVATRGGEWAEQSAPGEAVIRMLVVGAGARGAGAGEALVRACLDRARAAGKHRMVLSTDPRMTAAHRLYERLGFTRLPARDWTPVPGVDLLVYSLDLG